VVKRYLGNIITQNPTPPAGNFEGSAAKGVWSLEEQLAYQKAGLWPIAGNAPVDITDVFSTYLYDGTGAAHTITNGIDLAGEGGMIWGKIRSSTDQHWLVDSERGTGSNNNYKYLMSNLSNGESDFASRSVSSFNSNGFTLQNGTDKQFNESGQDYVSWSFRKAPKFFDLVTWTGDGVSGRTISHSLNSEVGFYVVKRLDASGDWRTYHRVSDSASNPHIAYLNGTSGGVFESDKLTATSTTFTIEGGFNGDFNSPGQTYVAYLFAHNDGDGEFGPDADQDIIKCGSFTSDGSGQAVVDLGFEPQFLLTKKTNSTGAWTILDSMRGFPTFQLDNNKLYPNTSGAEGSGSSFGGSTYESGFRWYNDLSGQDYIYIAIRRGPLAPPESATEVFDVNTLIGNGTSGRAISTGFVTDFHLSMRRTSNYPTIVDRLRGYGENNTKRLATHLTNAEQSLTGSYWLGLDTNDGYVLSAGYENGNSQSYVQYALSRAPNFFDVVAYSGNSTSGRTVSHNLGVAPEMMWVKSRGDSESWCVYHAGITNPEQNYLYLNEASALNPNGNTIRYWNHTAPTDTVFTLGDEDRVNQTADTYIAYLFATLPGVSKVGSYTGNGSTQTIDCGFTSGARFVLIKRTDTNGAWVVFDTARGISSSGNDPYLELNTTNAEASYNILNANPSGFEIIQPWQDFNATGGSYIFYAIA